jgi:hypothetical protein
MSIFKTITSGQVAYLASLYNKFKLSKNIHKKYNTCFYVEAAELQTVFGSDYRKTIEPFMVCQDEDYEMGAQACTKAFIFTEETIAAFMGLKAHEIKLPNRSTMDKTYEEKLNIKALTNVIETWDLKPETKLQLIILRAQTDEHGRNFVWYRRTSGPKGRRFAGCVSLQGIPDSVRQAIIDVSYSDIDMVNAHPTLFSGLAKAYGVDANKINFYIGNREKVLEKISAFFKVSRDASKDLMLALTFGMGFQYSQTKKRMGELSSFTKWCNENNAEVIPNDNGIVIPTFLKEYKAELNAISNVLLKSEISAWLPEEKRTKRKSSGVALLIQSIEDEALQVIERWCAYKGIKVMSLAFDGLIIEGVGHDFSECQMFVNIMLKDVYGIDADLKLKVKTEVIRND